MKVHLLEINSRPSLIMGDINDRKLKPQLIADCLNIIGIIPYSHDYKDGFAPFDNQDDNNEFNEDDEEKKINSVIKNSLCEFGRPIGRFDLIFPLKENINYYKKFFKRDYKENKFLWDFIINN